MNKKTGSIFIKGGRIEEPSSYLNGEVADILIENGIITKVGKELVCPGNVQVIELAGKYLSTTLFVPSVEHQKKSRVACEKLLQRAEEQYEFLGIEAEEAEMLSVAVLKFSTPIEICLRVIRICSEADACC